MLEDRQKVVIVVLVVAVAVKVAARVPKDDPHCQFPPDVYHRLNLHYATMLFVSSSMDAMAALVPETVDSRAVLRSNQYLSAAKGDPARNPVSIVTAIQARATDSSLMENWHSLVGLRGAALNPMLARNWKANFFPVGLLYRPCLKEHYSVAA